MKNQKVLLIGIVVILLLVGGILGWRMFGVSDREVATDEAQGASSKENTNSNQDEEGSDNRPVNRNIVDKISFDDMPVEEFIVQAGRLYDQFGAHDLRFIDEEKEAYVRITRNDVEYFLVDPATGYSSVADIQNKLSQCFSENMIQELMFDFDDKDLPLYIDDDSKLYTHVPAGYPFYYDWDKATIQETNGSGNNVELMVTVPEMEGDPEGDFESYQNANFKIVIAEGKIDAFIRDWGDVPDEDGEVAYEEDDFSLNLQKEYGDLVAGDDRLISMKDVTEKDLTSIRSKDVYAIVAIYKEDDRVETHDLAPDKDAVKELLEMIQEDYAALSADSSEVRIYLKKESEHKFAGKAIYF